MESSELEIRIGIEVHQQLNTGKLFCSCPSEIRDDDPDIVFTRRLLAAAGETGETDSAAEYEMGRERRYIYHAYNSTTCAIEMDEEPIHDMNKDALAAAILLSRMANAKVLDRVLVMRKTVVDGSNTSGFQRTALVAINGRIKTSFGEVTIPTICIEEESAKIVDSFPDFATYNLSRLGIPLIEIATGPDIRSPEHVKEVAETIGMMLRSTGKVRRGIGTIRQDINVSIKGGARVEIKGAQDLRLLPRIAETEVNRQKGLIEISEELRKRKADVKDKHVDVTGLIGGESELIRKVTASGGSVLAVKLKGFAGLVGKEIVPGRRLGKELSEHARNSAGVGGAIHSDELPNHGVNEKDFVRLRKELGCGEKDAFIFVADVKEKAWKGIDAILERAMTAIRGVPGEVRRANPDGTSSFLRPMPGSARMYPETDIRPIIPDAEGIMIPELIADKARKYEGMGLAKDLAQQMSRSELALDFERLSGSFGNVEPAFIASVILTSPKEIKKRHNLEIRLFAEVLEKIFQHVSKGSIAREAVFEILVDCARGVRVDEAIGKYRKLTDDELEEKIREIVSQNKLLPFNALIGKAMERLRGKADGKKIVDLLEKFKKQV
ncbi:Glu-tRNA(Gln) amidotransferase subunit GatE [Candidatus Woesearchaeota archaeon]|nr:Glu-tRNA(Gln) amidotransferase subunit GatE [Candidatus Woesearchaeota archaeon]